MLSLEDHPYLAPFDGSFSVVDVPTKPPRNCPDKKKLKKKLKKLRKKLDEQQRMLYAQDRYSVLLVFQALDAAGKDSTIRAAFKDIDPNGIHVHSFKAPSQLELEHDFLWRTARVLPRRGNIGIFNRSHYEEVLVVRVHPEYLKPQRLPEYESQDELWEQRYESIRDHELHLAQSGTVVIKFWLKHSRECQAERFLARIDDPEKRWKFSMGDVEERQHWDKYMHAYEDAIAATARPWAPWYTIPADNKPYMRFMVAKTVSDTLDQLDLAYPKAELQKEEELSKIRELLANGEM